MFAEILWSAGGRGRGVSNSEARQLQAALEYQAEMAEAAEDPLPPPPPPRRPDGLEGLSWR